MTTDPESNFRVLHATFCAVTGRTDRYEQYRYAWAEFSRCYTEQELIDTLNYILAVNKTRPAGKLIPTSAFKLIMDLPLFESHRADAELERKRLAARKRQWQASAGEVARAEMIHTEPTAPEQPIKKVDMSLVIAALKKGVEQAEKGQI